MGLYSNIKVDGEEHLAVSTGLDCRAYSKSTFLNFKDNEKGLKGTIIDIETGEKDAWQADKSIEDENTGEILIYGDNFPAATLYDLLTGGVEITFIQKIFGILITQASENPDFSAPGPEGILISPDRKKILIFDKDFILRCIRQHGEAAFVEKFCKWCHPALEGKWSFIFFLAVIEYYLLTETFPFSGKTQEEIHESIIYGDYVPIEKFFPGFDTGFSATLDSVLQRRKTKNKPEVNYEILFKFDFSMYRPDKTQEEKESVTEFKIKNKRKISVKKFFVKNKSGISVLGISLALIALAVVFVMQDYKDRPTTKDMSDLQVVYKFYDSISNLDQNWVTACSYEGSGDYYSQLITNIFVTGKMRESIKRERAFYTPGEWANLENPHEKNVFGITRFTVTPDEKNAQRGLTSVYYVDFYLLIPQVSSSFAELHNISAEELMKFYPLSAFHYKDIVNMIRVKGQWKIHSIINTERKEVAVDSDYYFMHNIPGKETEEVVWGPTQEEIETGRKKIEAYEASILLPDD